jgi:hypothetical protein
MRDGFRSALCQDVDQGKPLDFTKDMGHTAMYSFLTFSICLCYAASCIIYRAGVTWQRLQEFSLFGHSCGNPRVAPFPR